MIKNPKISVVMSAYNSKKYIAEAIESILNQTFKDFEFIIINDGSTDKTLEIIKNFLKKDKRIKLINNKKNLGLIKSLNKGLRTSKGKYIARMDADDISLPKRFQIQYDFLEKNPNVFLIGTGIVKINEKGKENIIFHPENNPNKVRNILLNKNYIVHPSIMFRNEKDIVYREKMWYCEDYDLYLRLISKNKRLSNLKDILIKYRITSNSISHSQRAKQDLFVKKAKEFYQQRLKYDKDEYNKFNPDDILSINIEKSKDKNIIESEIKASFKANDFKKTRTFCKKYFNNYGYFNKYIIYYLSSFLNKGIIDFFRKLIF